MPAQAGESLLSTVYADVHYFFRAAVPSQPQHDRFAKGSYVYLYYSPSDRRAKLEIANHAGTPDQDAFYGYLDALDHIKYSTKQPTLCTVVLDQPSIRTQSEWHLPTWDDRNEKKWAHKLHTIDLYFWKESDALAFMTKLNAVVPAERLDIGDLAKQSTPAAHRDSMSPVVQQLEKTASTSQYPPRAGSTQSVQSLPGPPTPASAASVPPPPPPQAAPMAYNPAAPAAPEPISHREKTPPPPDGAAGTGLAHAAAYDNAPQHGYGISQQYAHYPQQQQNGSSLQSTPQSSYFPGPPQAAAPPPPPPNPQAQKQPSFGPGAASTVQHAAFPQGGYAPDAASTSVQSPGVYNHMPPTPSAPPAYQAMQASLPPPPASAPPNVQQQQASQIPQVAGFSSYSYTAGPQSPPAPGHYSQAGAFTGDVHGQFYRPTEEEASHGKHKASKPQGQTTEDKYRISERVSKVEKGIGGFLKKLDQKF